MILVTGGTGFVGRSVVRWLEMVGKPHLVFRGRINDPVAIREPIGGPHPPATARGAKRGCLAHYLKELIMVMPYSHNHPWKGRNLKLGSLLLVVLLLGVYAWWAVSNNTQVVDDLDFLNVNGLPLAFVPNMGQSDPGVKFQAQSGATSLFLTNDGLTMVWPVAGTEAGENEVGNAAALSMHFLDVNPDLDVVTSNALPGTVNYLQGNDAANWYANVATYGAVTYQQFYAGVNLHYASKNGQLVTLFEVAPGTNPEVIRWMYDDDVLVSVDETTGDLLLSLKTMDKTSTLPYVIPAPKAWQMVDGDRLLINAHYSMDKTSTLPYVIPAPKAWQMVDGDRLLINAHYSMATNGQVSLNVKRSLDSATLFIEQTALRTSENYGYGYEGWEIAGDIAVDAAGNIYLTGTTHSSDFPSTARPWTGGGDAFVTKIAPDGSTILFSTYLGGQLVDRGEGIAVDNTGHVYVTGETISSDFPLQMPYQPVKGSVLDAFVSKLTPDGSGLVYSTYLGGSGSWGTGADYGTAIAVDNLGQAYVTGGTGSADFPLVNPYQSNGSGFVTKFNTSGTALVFSTRLGGNVFEYMETIAVDQAHTVFVAGSTHSSDFPVVNPYQSGLMGKENGFLTRFAASGNSLIYSTYLGGGYTAIITDIAVDNVGNVYTTGWTSSSQHPLVNPIQTFGGGLDAFITKFSPTGSELVYSTYLGGSGEDFGKGIAVDDNNQVHISGSTRSSNFPTVNAVQSNIAGMDDIFITKINSSGSALIFSTYLGGSDFESNYGWGGNTNVAVTQSGQVNVIGDTFSSDFPVVNPYQSQLNGEKDIVVAGLAPSGSAFEFSTYLGGSGYLPPTDVTLTGVEGSNPFSNIWLWLVMGLILVVGAWVTRPRTRKPRSVE